MKKFKYAIIGLGNRGKQLRNTLMTIKDVECVAVCDTRLDFAERSANFYVEKGLNKPAIYTDYKKCIDEIDVSLDFAIKEKHNYFRGQPKAYDWAINTLKMLQQDNKTATIVFVGFEETMKHENIDGLFEIAKKYNALIRLNVYRPVSDNEEINKKFGTNIEVTYYDGVPTTEEELEKNLNEEVINDDISISNSTMATN